MRKRGPRPRIYCRIQTVMVKVLKISLYMSNEKNFSKNFDGLTKEESERLLELERSLELGKAKPKIENNFLSFVKYAWPDFIEGSHHKIINKKFNELASGKIKTSNHQHAAKTHKVGVCLILTPGMDDWP